VSEGLAQGPYVAARVGFERPSGRKAPNLPLSHHAPYHLNLEGHYFCNNKIRKI